MRIAFIWLLLALAMPVLAQKKDEVASAKKPAAAQDRPFRILKNRNFSKGEKLTYLAHYGFIHAAKGVVTLDKNFQQRNGRNCYVANIDAKTIGMFAIGMKVQDTWRSYIDAEAIMPHEFFRNISENKYKLEETSYFSQQGKKVEVHRLKKGNKRVTSYDIPTYTQDMVSGYYFLRTLDFNAYKPGDLIKMDAFFEDQLYDFQIKFMGREVVKTKFGKMNAFILAPIMPENTLFDGKDAIQIWISDDANRVPLMVKAKLFVGAFEIELVEHEGLQAEFNWAK